MRSRRTTFVAALAALVLVAAACGDDGDDAPAAPNGESEVVFGFRPLDVGGPLTKEALRRGDIQIALLFSSDAEIAVNDWVELDDDQNLQQIENLLPAIRIDAVSPEVTAALDAVSERLTTSELIIMNKANSVDLQEPAQIAQNWLTENDLLPYEGDRVAGTITVGSTNFAEQEIVAELYAHVLESAGATVNRRFQLGAREIVAPALQGGDIDLYPEYLGSYMNWVDADAEVPSDPDDAAEVLRDRLENRGITVLDPAPAENRNTFVVTREIAERYSLEQVSDLADVPDRLVLGGPPECPNRPFCLVGLKEVYGLQFDV